jgi:four helix bundle protein
VRNHKKLRAFELADELAIAVYQVTSGFPRSEAFALTSQLRRAAVSIASNIVEGCARDGQCEYLRFLDISYGSAREVEYQLSLARRLGYVGPGNHRDVEHLAEECSKVLGALIRRLRSR